MAVKVSKDEKGAFHLESDDDSNADTVTVGLALDAMSKNKKEKKELKKKIAPLIAAMDEVTFEKCKTAAKDIVLKITDLREPDAKRKSSKP